MHSSQVRKCVKVVEAPRAQMIEMIVPVAQAVMQEVIWQVPVCEPMIQEVVKEVPRPVLESQSINQQWPGFALTAGDLMAPSGARLWAR